MFKKIHFPYKLWLISLVFSASIFAQAPADTSARAGIVHESAKISLIIARPATSSKNNPQELSWVPAFSHEFLLFRLGVFNQIRVVDPETLAVHVRGYNLYGETPPSEQSYLAVAQKLNATHVLFPKYEADKSSKSIRFSLTLLSTDDSKNSLKGESTGPIDKIDVCLDSCVSQLLQAWGIQPDQNASKFLRTAITGSGKCEKSIGNDLRSASSSKGAAHKKIAEDLKKCSDQEPQAYLTYYVGALEYAKGGDFENAGLLLKDLIYKLGPVYPSLYPRAARYFRLAEKFEDGLQMVKLCEGLNLQAENLTEEKARLLEGIEDWDKAKEAYLDVLSSDPANYHALLFLMKKYNKDRQPEKALDESGAFLQAYPDNGTGLLEKGKALIALQRFSDAQPVLSRTAVLMPDNAEPHLLLGDVYQHNGDNGMAIKCYSRALELTPDNVALYIKIARSRMLMKDPAAALAGLKKVEKKFYDNAEVQKGIGMAEYQLGDTAAAKRDLARFMQSGEPDVAACLTLGELYFNTADYAKSLEIYEKALKIDPGNSIAEGSVRTVKAKLQGIGEGATKNVGESTESQGGVRAITVLRVLSGVVCVAGIAGGFYMNSKLSGLQDQYNKATSTSDVNSLHTSLKNDQLFRNVSYGVGGLFGVGFGVTFAIPSGAK
ncbi:MAG: tetratricopeptide repeat protein [Chitinivibrionales bacterium]